MIDVNHPFSNASAPDLRGFRLDPEIEAYIARNGGISTEAVEIQISGQWAECRSATSGRLLGIGNSEVHDLQKMIATWQYRYPNHRFI